MSVVAAAVIGSTLVGVSASKSAAKSAAKGQEKGLQVSQEMSQQAIGQAKDYFNIGQRSSQAGFQSALDFFKNVQPAKYEPMIQGNLAAQRAIGQGAQQANNAILGLPVDMSFTNQQVALNPNYSAIRSAQLPVLGGQQIANEEAMRPSPQPNPQYMNEQQSREYFAKQPNILGAR